MSTPPLSVQRLVASFGIDTKVAWHRLSGGQTNQLWLLVGAGLVVKLFRPGAENPLFPNLPRQEALMLGHLAPKGLAPELMHLADCPEGVVLVYRHVTGTPWQQDPARAATLLRRLHQTPAPDGLRPLAGGSDLVLAQAAPLLHGLPDSKRLALLALRPDTPVTAWDKTCLLHGDPVPGNLLMRDAGDMLIDWQCPALGDPAEDLALFLSPAMQLIYRGKPLTEVEVTTFLTAYDDTEIAERVQQMAPWHHWRMALYCAWRAIKGSATYAAAYELERDALIRTRAPAGS